MEFDPRAVNSYTLEQLMSFMHNGVVTFAQLQSFGLNWQMQQRVMEEIEEREKKRKEAETEYQAACSIDNIQSYSFFINKYEGKDYAADLVAQARMRKGILEEKTITLKRNLFSDMRVAPWKYTAEIMRKLFNGVGADQMEIYRNANSDTIDTTIRDFILSCNAERYLRTRLSNAAEVCWGVRRIPNGTYRCLFPRSTSFW